MRQKCDRVKKKKCDLTDDLKNAYKFYPLGQFLVAK